MGTTQLVAKGVRRAMQWPYGVRLRTPRLVFCGHHRAGSSWMTRVLRSVADDLGLRVRQVRLEDPRPKADILIVRRSNWFYPGLAGDRGLRGVHLIRDPRDIAVSSYHYHLWTHEEWAHQPQERYGGRSYQQHLRTLDRSDGMAAEIQRTCEAEIPLLVGWDYSRPGFLELRYESLIASERDEMERMFRHFGFTDRAVERALRAAESQGFEARTGRKVGEEGAMTHERSGLPGQWRTEWEPRHVEQFKDCAGEALIQLGYETSTDW